MSPVDNLPPTGRQINRKANREDRRLTDIERRRIDEGPASVSTADEFPGFSTGGVAIVGMIAAPWYARLPHSYVAARISCAIAGSGDLNFDLDLNGSTVVTLTLASGETTHKYAAVFSIAPDEFLGGTITDVDGQVGVSVQLEEAT